MLERLRRLFGGARRAPPPPPAAKAAATGPAAPPSASPSAANAAPDPTGDIDLYEDLSYPREALRPVATIEPTDEAASRDVERVFAYFRGHEKEIPAYPAVAHRIFQLIESPDPDMNELVRTISQDPSTSVQILKVANSPLYSRGHEVCSIRDAVVRLGPREIADIAVAVSTRTLFDLESRASYEQFQGVWNGLWHHSMTSAFAAAWLAAELKLPRQESAFMCAILHDIGKTIALRAITALIMAGELSLPDDEAWVAQLLEETHVDLGGEAALLWGLPSHITRICLEHHNTELSDVQNEDDAAIEGIRHAVRLMSGLYQIRSNPHHRASLPVEVQTAVEALGLNPYQLRSAITQMNGFAQTAASLST